MEYVKTYNINTFNNFCEYVLLTEEEFYDYYLINDFDMFMNNIISSRALSEYNDDSDDWFFDELCKDIGLDDFEDDYYI